MKYIFLMMLMIQPVLNDDIVLIFTGDIMMHQAVKECSAAMNISDENGRSVNNGGFDCLFENISPLISESDLAAGNMEFPVCFPYKSLGVIFNSRPESVAALKKAGFGVLSLANNHIHDQNTEGVIETLLETGKNGITALGVAVNEKDARRGFIADIKGRKIAFYAATGLLNYYDRRFSKKYYVNWFYDESKVTADIKRLKNQSDFVVLMFHTGTEYTTIPGKKDSSLCRKYAEAGADIIIGHHPHVLQPYEYYKRKNGGFTHIFYSLGNFISDQNKPVKIPGKNKYIYLNDSAVVRIIISGNSVRAEVIPIHTTSTESFSNGIRFRRICNHTLSSLLKEAEKTGDANKVRLYKERADAVKSVVFRNGETESASPVEE